MKRSVLALIPVLAAFATVHCGKGYGTSSQVSPQAANDGGADAGEPDKPLVPATKVDLLFMVDNSSSMGDKQALLATALSRILRELTTGSADHAAVTDLHLGVISSSLGNQGGDICTDDGSHPRNDDHAHLLNHKLDPTGVTPGDVVPGAEQGFLAYGPGGITDIAAFESAASDVILGVDQTGCGFEAQLEAVYRFLAQPDPPTTITTDPATLKVIYGPPDAVLLAQRKAFLRPDSAVVVVMLTDEDDSAVDPSAAGGTGWKYDVRKFPDSNVSRGSVAQGTTAPRGSSACATNPADPTCVSCGACNSDPACPEKNDAVCTTSAVSGQSGPGINGYYGPTEDDLNVRMQQMKRRYGVDPQYPVDRYIKALTERKVPNIATEHDADGTYVHAPTCTNPLFAASLPGSASEELCNLPDGPRSNRLVFFQLIGGLPPSLAGASPDWTKILGAHPATYDQTGIDVHMIQSVTPRAGLTGDSEPRGQNGTDPINGREWNTQGRDLQYACTFPLPAPRSCVSNPDSCDCADDPNGGTPPNPPICATDGSATQIYGKAYPTVRELRVVQGLGDRGLVGSICSVDPQSGYGPLLESLATKLSGVLAK